MVNVYAIVNRDIFGVPTHLPSPTHVSVPNVVIETREAKAHAMLRTVPQKKRQVQETYKTFQSPQAECIHLKYPPRYYPEIIFCHVYVVSGCFGIDCEEPHTQLMWEFWRMGKTIRKEMNWNAGRSSMVLLRSRLQEPRKSIHHQHRCELCPSALFLSRGNKGTTKQSNFQFHSALKWL